MKRSLLLTSLASAALLAPGLVLAQPPEGPPPGGQMNRPNPRRAGEAQPRQNAPGPNRVEGRRDAWAQLGLTEVQQEAIRKNTESARRERLLKTTDLKIASMDLSSLLRDETVDEKAVAARLAAVQAAQGALLKLRVDSALALKKILTPEQQKMMREFRRGRGQPRMNRRMNAPRSPGMGQGNPGPRTRPNRPRRGNPGEVSDFDSDFLDLDRLGDAPPNPGDLR